MENKVNEENNTANATTTPVEAIANTAENATQTANTNAVADTATADNKVNETATATTNSSAATESKPKNDSGLPKGVRKELWELRETVRNLKQELVNSKSNVQVTNTPNPAVEVEEVNLLDNPDKWAKSHEQKVTAKVKAEILAEMEQAKEADRIKRENDEGINFLLSKKEVADDPDAKAEIAEILQRPDMAYVAAKYPAKAAKLAYDEFISGKGVSVERKNIVANNIAANSTTPSTAKPMTKKIWSRAEIQTVLSDFSNPKYAEIEAEIRQAAKEGRVK